MIKNLFVATIVFFIFSSNLCSQENYNSSNMVVSIADLENNTYKKDTTANALVIHEKGYSRVQNGGNYNLLTDYERKIKILNKKGAAKATVKVFLYRNKSDKELFRKLVAYTHNVENGKIIKNKVLEKNIYKEDYNENLIQVKFTFPNISPGSVISYKYQVESPFMFNFNGWDFQEDIPKLHSEYITDLPGNFVYNIKLVGTLKLTENESTIKKNCLEVGGGGVSECSHNVYVMKNIPAFKEEKYMTAKKNYFSRVHYELKEFKGFDGVNKKYTETWKNVDSKLKKEPNIGLQLKKINATSDILPDSIQKLPNNLVKAKKIYRYITRHYTWNGKYEFFKSSNKDSEIKEVIKNKTGNVSGINILTHNTLKQQGFEVAPVILSTRKNGYITKIHPVISDFNYIVTQLSLNDETFLLDATENTLMFGEVPYRCLNQEGRLLDFKNGSKWIDIRPKQNSYHFLKEKIILDENLTLQGHVEHAFSGYHSYFKRKELDQIDKEKLIDKIKRNNEDITISNLVMKNEKDPEKNFEENFDFSVPLETIDDFIYINPFLTPFFKENPFKLAQRTYPVDFGYKDSYVHLVSLKLPEGYGFIDIPKNSTYAIPNNLGNTSVGYQNKENELIITHRIVFNSSYYPSEYYPILKEFFNLIVQIENDTLITIKKIN